MARRPNDQWDARIRAIRQENSKLGPKPILDQLVKEAEEHGIPTDTIPSERGIARRLEVFDGLPAAAKAEYSLLYWPESFEHRLLPEEAAPAAMRLLRYSWPRRPTVQFARNWWRIATVRPDFSDDVTSYLAWILTVGPEGFPIAGSKRSWRESVELRLVTGKVPAIASLPDFPAFARELTTLALPPEGFRETFDELMGMDR